MAFEEAAAIPGVNMQDLRLKGFRVHKLPSSIETPVRQGRRDFYKMGLVEGDMTINHGGRHIDIKGTALFFVNPKAPRSLVQRMNRNGGYACIFTESFILSRGLQDSPLFSVGDNPVIPLNAEQIAFMTGIFQKMLAVYTGIFRIRPT